MAMPGIITGGDGRPNVAGIFRRTGTDTEARSNQGVFGRNPGATPKYATNRGGVDAEYRESMARLFVDIPAGDIEAFLSTVSTETRPLARVLTTASDASGGGTGFIDFLLTSTQEDFQEKAQIVDTLTDNYVAFYSGQVPPLFRYQGTLLNTYQDDQRVWMLRLYREILRGSRLASRNLIARLRYDSFIVSGYLENLQLGLSGDTDHVASSFNFSMRVKQLNIFTPALGAPTVAQTAATTASIINGNNTQRDASARTGTVTSDTPMTPNESPGATVPQLTQAERENTRALLREQGLSDAEIDEALALADETSRISAGGGATHEVDPRETQIMSTVEGRDRVSNHVRGVASRRAPLMSTPDQLQSVQPETNPENATNDGSGGETNIFGPGAFTMDQSSTTLDVLTAQSGTLSNQQFNALVLQQTQARQAGDASVPAFPLRTRDQGRNRGRASR
jgi:hypothetical protein